MHTKKRKKKIEEMNITLVYEDSAINRNTFLESRNLSATCEYESHRPVDLAQCTMVRRKL